MRARCQTSRAAAFHNEPLVLFTSFGLKNLTWEAVWAFFKKELEFYFCAWFGVQECSQSYKGFPKGVQPLFLTSLVFRNVSGKENATLQLLRKVSFIVVSAVLQSVTRRE